MVVTETDLDDAAEQLVEHVESMLDELGDEPREQPRRTVSQQVFIRGVARYKDGHVLGIVKIHNGWVGLIQGDSDYYVTQSLHGDTWKCSCPSHFTCWHMVATGHRIMEETDRLAGRDGS